MSPRTDRAYLVGQYAKLHQSRKYGKTAIRRLAQYKELVQQVGAKSILDFGCGQSGLLAAMKLGVSEHSYDPAIPQFSDMPTEKVELTICMDVLEHIPEDQLKGIFRQIHGATTKTAIFSICTRKAYNTLPDGQNAHVTVHKEKWWINRLQQYFNDLEVVYRKAGENFIVKGSIAKEIVEIPEQVLEQYILDTFTGYSVGIVGNAQINTKWGKEIDGHDYVIRINNFSMARKYADLVGTKATHWCTHGKAEVGVWNRHDFPFYLCPFLRKGTIPTPGVFPHKDWRSTTGIPRLTTGATMLMILNKFHIQTTAYGFDFLKTGHYFNSYHAHGDAHKKQIDEEEALVRSFEHVKIKEG